MTQIKVTLKQIRDNDPCTSGWVKVLKANGGLKADYDKSFPLSSILDSNDLDDTLWCLDLLPEHNNLWRKYAWWCASQVAHLTDDKRVHDCLAVVLRHSEGKATDEELRVARKGAAAAAAGTATAAAWAADYASAADAAYAARRAADAAYAARHAADAARRAVYDSAAAAAWAARDAAARKAQADKLRQILDAGKWVD
jgi:hypothetical protein